jgi:ribonuclease HII
MQTNAVLACMLAGVVSSVSTSAFACATHKMTLEREFTDAKGLTTKKYKVLATNICEFPVLYSVELKCGPDVERKNILVPAVDAKQITATISTRTPFGCGSTGSYVQR